MQPIRRRTTRSRDPADGVHHDAVERQNPRIHEGREPKVRRRRVAPRHGDQPSASQGRPVPLDEAVDGIVAQRGRPVDLPVPELIGRWIKAEVCTEVDDRD